MTTPYEPTEQEGLLEHEPDNTPLEIPPDKRRVKTDKQDVPIETLQMRIKKGRLDIQPEFQRYYVWSPSKASKLIESVLLEIPIPVVYLAEEQDNRQSVVDGQQRLTSIVAFLDGLFPGPDKATFKLTSLQVLKELNGLTFKELDAAMQEKILGTPLRLVIIQKDSDPDVKFEVFERLNVGAVALNDQELRNCVYRGSYNKLLRELSQNEHLLKVLRQEQPHPRMQDRQLILRFFAMWRKTHLKYKSPMKQFLNHEMEQNRNIAPEIVEEMREIFARSIEMAYVVFGQNAFRRFYPGNPQEPNGNWEPKKLNIALWDTILYGFSYFEKAQIIPIADAVREEFLDLMGTDDQFVKFITSTTDQPDRVQYRADIWIKRLRELVGYKGAEPRNFSLALKQKLFEVNPACAICGQHMHDIDDTEVDHILHYWRGGKTISQNARLTHRFCNRQRGGRE